MSPNGISSGFDEIFTVSSSDSSDSESLLREDIKKSGTRINKQWEAIERTLYQEPGPQVTDSELLKECKLWRETFPHFRVKGTKLDVEQTGNDEEEETDKSIQTLKNHFDLKKLEEKRQNIKTKVVGMLVDRLISKYGPNRGNANSEVDASSGVQITEVEDDPPENLSTPTSNLVKSANRNSDTVVSTDNESYFERGKLLLSDDDDEKMGEELREILSSWERDTKTAKELPKTNLKKEFKILKNPKNNSVMKFSDRPIKEGLKPKRHTPPRNSLGRITKPFEMTKKIDKKYEGLVDKIFERKSNELETTRHCHTSASGFDMRNFEDALEELRLGTEYEDYMKRSSNLRLNKFDNNWLKRSETNFAYTEYSFPGKKKTSGKPQSKVNLYSERTQEEIDDKFMEELKAISESEVALRYKRSSKRSGVIEKINLARPKPFRPAQTEKTAKSFSCGDLQKKNKKDAKSRQMKSGVAAGKNELNLKKAFDHVNHKGSRSNPNQNPILPPIESGIICTELTGRPKIGAKITPKRY